MIPILDSSIDILDKKDPMKLLERVQNILNNLLKYISISYLDYLFHLYINGFWDSLLSFIVYLT